MHFTHGKLNLMPEENIPVKKFEAKLVGKRVLGGDIYEITIEFASDFSFSAGQYVWVELPDLIFPDSHGTRRAFSITTAPGGNQIQIILRTSNSGYKKTLLNLKPGDPLIIHGPFGSFMKNGLDGSGDIIFVGGGMAVAPYLSVIRDLPKHIKNRQIYLIHVSKESESVYEDELKNIDTGSKNFSYIQYFDRVTPQQVSELSQKFPEANWYITGPQGFVDSVWEYVKASKINPDKVAFEEHYPMVEYANLTLKDLEADSSSVFKMALDKAFFHVIITDVNGYILYANEMAQKMTGYSEAEMLGSSPRLWGGMMTPDFYQQLWRTKKTQQVPFSGKINNRRKNGEIYTTQTTISPIVNSGGQLLGFIGTEEDITKSEETTKDLERSNRLMVNRELKMVELKKEIEELHQKT